MKYPNFFNKLLLEQDLPEDNSSRVYDTPPSDLGGFLDTDTDPDKLLTQGMQDTFNAIQQRFSSQMTNFANTLSPEAVESMPLGELRKKVGEVFKFVNKIQIYSKGKIEQISEDPYAVMAAFLASEPTKISAFADLHKNLDEFQTAIQDIEGQLSSLKGQIDDFVSDVEDIDAENAAMKSSPRQSDAGSGYSTGDNGMRGQPQSTGPSSGMSYQESRQRRSKHHRRPVRG